VTTFLTPATVAIETAIADIGNVFLIVFIDHLILVMTGIAIVFCPSRGMALTAIAIRIAMVHRETVIEGCPTPGGGIVAL
jgi:hypothetical protein